MDKNAIKKFAVWARRELIARVSQKAEQYGITEEHHGDAYAERIGEQLLTRTEQNQRKNLITRIEQEGYQQVMEEVAYTWFNRFIALRFMEVNNYLPTRIRVFTDEENAFKPQILAEAIHMEMDGLDMDKVYQLKSDNKTEELYKYLLITQCNALSSILPGMFQRISDYTELLFPDNLLREGSVIEQMVSLIPESDWQDQVQIIGWLYQYYNTEPKDQVFANLKKNIKISKHDIPAATQLFTPDWIVRYMVENSLGRLWVEGHPDEALKSNWKYYLEEAEQEPEVQAQLAEIRREYAGIKPEDIKCIDPCMGSGHILCYLFDVLVQIYEAYGYSTREAVQSIVENNLYGLDIDDRAAQLAYFAVMMKARQYDRRFFTRGIQPHVMAIQESAKMPEDAWDYFGVEKAIAQRVYMAFADAKEYGSLIEPNVTLEEIDALDVRLTEIDRMADYGNLAVQALMGTVLTVMEPLMKQARMLAQKYDAVVTNPPYMGQSGMSGKLAQFTKDCYAYGKGDLFAAFMQRADEILTKVGFAAMIVMESWMFLASYEELRHYINNGQTIINMVHMPYLGKGGTSLGINFGTTALTFRKGHVRNYSAQYEYTVYYECDAEGVPFVFPTQNDKWKNAKQESFSRVPGEPIIYDASDAFLRMYDHHLLGDVCVIKKGSDTGNNDRYVRFWYEPILSKVAICHNKTDRWVPYVKGGEFRKWYGNIVCVVDWENNGQRIRSEPKATIRNEQFFFQEGITWSDIGMNGVTFRYFPKGCLRDNRGPALFTEQRKMLQILGYLNSKISDTIRTALNPTICFQVGSAKTIPFIVPDNSVQGKIDALVSHCIRLSQLDWDSYETSWDYGVHPLIQMITSCLHPNSNTITISECYKSWSQECEIRFQQLKSNEEELNRIFIDIYGLQDELTPEVEDKDVTVRRADLGRDIRSFISYAVGCMFGRYSLSKPGLAFAGGEWDAGNYTSDFQPDKDGILPITDDEYFGDDIVNRFVRFVEVAFGKNTLEENLAFIAKALGGTGTPRDVIRSYFLNDFYADHLKIYQKRPIYWLFDSGKKNGFKALIYMHRYAPDTIARIRTDYVHEQQSRYRTAIADLENRIISDSTAERVKLNKQLTKVKAQAEELRLYEEKIHHLADQMISIDLDDGVKVNYAKFADVLAKIK